MCTRASVMSLPVFVMAAVLYLSVSADFLRISGIRRLVPRVVCMCVFCLRLLHSLGCVFECTSRNTSTGFFLCVRAGI